MNPISTIFNTLLVFPFINLLLLFYNVFIFLHIPGPLGWSIIAITIIIRIALNPIMNKQYDSTRKMQELKPQIEKLQKKYKNDKQRIQQEQMRLYKEHGVNPVGGCLPLLLQMPIIYALFAVFRQVLQSESTQEVVMKLNEIAYLPFLHIDSLDLTFFGVNLALKPNQWQEYGVWLLLIPVITAVLTFIQSKRMTGMQAQSKSQQNQKGVAKKDEKQSAEDAAASMQKQMIYIMPLMIGFFAYSFALGLSLYWNVSTLVAIIAYDLYIKKRNKAKLSSPK